MLIEHFIILFINYLRLLNLKVYLFPLKVQITPYAMCTYLHFVLISTLKT